MNKNESTDPEDIETSEEVPEDIETSEEVPEETSDNEEAHSVPLEQYEKIKDDYLRLAADFENFKKRAEKEKSMSTVTSLSRIISTLLPLIDNFEIAMNQDGTPTEIEALYKMTQVFLDTINVKEVPGIGEPFDLPIMKLLSNQVRVIKNWLEKSSEKVMK